MAEGWTRHLRDDVIDVCSAGIEARSLDLRAVQVMAEAGVDISGQYAKKVADLAGEAFDYVVTVCDHARENCPVFPGRAVVVHHGFDDPPELAATAGTEQEALDHYRRVRDEIRAYVEALPEALLSTSAFTVDV
jgi:arsenate reductase